MLYDVLKVSLNKCNLYKLLSIEKTAKQIQKHKYFSNENSQFSSNTFIISPLAILKKLN